MQQKLIWSKKLPLTHPFACTYRTSASLHEPNGVLPGAAPAPRLQHCLDFAGRELSRVVAVEFVEGSPLTPWDSLWSLGLRKSLGVVVVVVVFLLLVLVVLVLVLVVLVLVAAAVAVGGGGWLFVFRLFKLSPLLLLAGFLIYECEYCWMDKAKVQHAARLEAASRWTLKIGRVGRQNPYKFGAGQNISNTHYKTKKITFDNHNYTKQDSCQTPLTLPVPFSLLGSKLRLVNFIGEKHLISAHQLLLGRLLQRFSAACCQTVGR